MKKINQLIIQKLERFDKDTVAIGKKALDLAKNYPEQAIADQLESFVRRIVRNKSK